MKILLSAYACEPHRGSEPGVGWNWARTLASQGHDVHILTRSNNREALEPAIAQAGLSLRASYYDLPRWARAWKKRPGGIHMYYLLWQMGAYRLAKQLHARFGFERVHHVTFASFRQPSFMGGLGIPFLFGPVGGGETSPPGLLHGLPARFRRAERLRDLANTTVHWDPMMRLTFARASVIACTTEETRQRIPQRYQARCRVLPTIGIEMGPEEMPPAEAPEQPSFLFVGRLLYWKGLHLALRALAEVRRQVPGVRLQVIGAGDDESWLRQVAQDAGVADLVHWTQWMPFPEIQQQYRTNTAFVFPSLHDSGGMVVLESLRGGLPVICLGLGGPAALVTPSCGVVVDVKGHSTEQEVIAALATAMTGVATDAGLRARLAAGCVPRARELSWERGAEILYRAKQELVTSRE